MTVSVDESEMRLLECGLTNALAAAIVCLSHILVIV